MRPIHIAHLDKARPVLVLTREVVIPQRTQVPAAPYTWAARALSVYSRGGRPTGLAHDSVVNCDIIVTIPKTALGERIGYLLPPQEAALTAAIRVAFDLE